MLTLNATRVLVEAVVVTEKKLAESSDPPGWDRLSLIPKYNVRPASLAPSVTCSEKHRRGLKRSLYGLAFLVGGFIVFISGALCAIALLADDNCGPDFGHFGCETRTEAESLQARPASLARRRIPYTLLSISDLKSQHIAVPLDVRLNKEPLHVADKVRRVYSM